MLVDIIEVKVLGNYNLYLRFEDGLNGVVDISKIIPFIGVFAKLTDVAYFETVCLNRELGTIIWDNGADISPDFLYSLISHKVA